MSTTNNNPDALEAVLDQAHTQLPPSMWKVLLLNDDFTPMDFVVDVLVDFFAKDHEEATRIMFEVHHQGRGVCGIYTKDIAATKVTQVNEHAREHEHPLKCIMEEV